MNVNQVLDIFVNPSSPDDAGDIWMFLKDGNNRNGYLCLDFDKYPSFKGFADITDFSEKEFEKAADLLRADSSIQDFSNRPRIEDASPALQNLFDEMENADAITYFDDESNKEWENLGLSREEYEKQIDDDILKFGLDGIICKYNDEDALYTCYGDFLCSFSKAGGKELVSSGNSIEEEIGEISSMISDGSNPMVSISFIPVDFQRDKEAPFRICEIMDRSIQDSPRVTYVVVRDGKDEAIFSVSAGKGQQQDHAFFSALDYIADVYHDSVDLALKNFDGSAYVKKYYEIALFSNPATRLLHSPVELDSFWKQEMPVGYSTSEIFGGSLVGGKLSPDIISEFESMFNANLENPTFHLNSALIAQLDKQPLISAVRLLDDSFDITETPLFAAAQYEWEKDRTKKIFGSTEKELLAFLSALDSAIEKYGPSRASLDCFSEMVNDFCYGKEDEIRDAGIPVSSTFGSSNHMESVYINCHKALKAIEQSLGSQNKNVMSV